MDVGVGGLAQESCMKTSDMCLFFGLSVIKSSGMTGSRSIESSIGMSGVAESGRIVGIASPKDKAAMKFKSVLYDVKQWPSCEDSVVKLMFMGSQKTVIGLFQ
jgi:hypothetical protein